MTSLKATVATIGVAALGVGTPAWAGTLTVDCVAGPLFTIDLALTASAPGDTIVVLECPVGHAPFTVLAKSDLRIVGADSANGVVGAFPTGVGFLHASPVFVDGSAGTCATIDSSTDITIANLRFENCDVAISEVSGARNTMHGLAINFPTGVGYLADGPQGSVFAGNLILKPGGGGVRIKDTVDQLVFDNRILQSYSDGIELIDDANTSVLNNQIVAALGDGISASGSSDPAIDLNDTTAVGSGVLVDVATELGEVVGNDAGGSVTNNSSSTLAIENI